MIGNHLFRNTKFNMKTYSFDNTERQQNHHHQFQTADNRSIENSATRSISNLRKALMRKSRKMRTKTSKFYSFG